METRNGLLRSEDCTDLEKLAVVDMAGVEWTFGQIGELLETFEMCSWLVGRRVGVLVSDRLTSGLISIAMIEVGTCIPLNSEFTQSELIGSVQALGVEVLLLDDRELGASLADLGLAVVLFGLKQRTLEFNLLNDITLPEPRHTDTALVLQTSGTTGEPKAVELSDRNLRSSIGSLIDSLELGPDDVCLNFLPMMHVGGLVDLLLAPLVAGGQVVFADAGDPERVLNKLVQNSITWLQGSPAILSNLVKIEKRKLATKLRFVRSVSAPISPELHQSVELFFDVPVIEIYGMSETAGVITSNPLPPGQRRIGSVGFPVNCEIEIRNVNEVWVRGDNVFKGYRAPFDNDTDWDGDWFFTGDSGRVDSDGYLYLTGRFKEQINRGGQKVSPKEIDDIVESWPEVKEAASFSVPHATLGEEIGLTILLKTGYELPENEIRNRLVEALAFYKRPKVIHFLDKLPRNESGKLQRHLISGLVDSLGSTIEEVSTRTEIKVEEILRSTLGLERAGLDEDFFELGGDSLSATSLIARLEREFTISLEGLVFYENASIRALSRFVDQQSSQQLGKGRRQDASGLSPRLQRKLDALLFTWKGVPPFEGALCREMKGEPPATYGRFFWCANNRIEFEGVRKALEGVFQTVGFRTLHRIQKRYLRNYSKLVRTYADQIERIQPEGEYTLGGFCDGGRIMVEVAQELEARGKTVRHIVLSDYVCTRRLDIKVSLVFSRDWVGFPLRLWDHAELAWRKNFGQNFEFMIWEGAHGDFGAIKFQSDLKEFLIAEAKRTSKPEPTERKRIINPNCKVKLVGKLPRVLKFEDNYSAVFAVSNRGEETIFPEDGVVLHARWRDLEKPKYGESMRARLKEPLKAGETQEITLVLVPKKKNRLYRIQVGFIEEGREWPTGSSLFQRWIAAI